MQATYDTIITLLIKDSAPYTMRSKYGSNARQLHKEAMNKAMSYLGRETSMGQCVGISVYTCLESGKTRGHGQTFERCSNRMLQDAHWTHTDF